MEEQLTDEQCRANLTLLCGMMLGWASALSREERHPAVVAEDMWEFAWKASRKLGVTILPDEYICLHDFVRRAK